jgi:hypothetical protein
VVEHKECVLEEAAAVIKRIDRMREFATIDDLWRTGASAILRERGRRKVAESVGTCRRFGTSSGPILCHRLKFCITCLRWELARACRSDEAH